MAGVTLVPHVIAVTVVWLTKSGIAGTSAFETYCILAPTQYTRRLLVELFAGNLAEKNSRESSLTIKIDSPIRQNRYLQTVGAIPLLVDPAL